MVPTRMRISLTMRAVYIGSGQGHDASTRPRPSPPRRRSRSMRSSAPTTPHLQQLEVVEERGSPGWPTGLGPSPTGGSNYSNQQLRQHQQRPGPRPTPSTRPSPTSSSARPATAPKAPGLGRNNLPTSVECSGLVVGATRPSGGRAGSAGDTTRYRSMVMWRSSGPQRDQAGVRQTTCTPAPWSTATSSSGMVTSVLRPLGGRHLGRLRRRLGVILPPGRPGHNRLTPATSASSPGPRAPTWPTTPHQRPSHEERH